MWAKHVPKSLAPTLSGNNKGVVKNVMLFTTLKRSILDWAIARPNSIPPFTPWLCWLCPHNQALPCSIPVGPKLWITFSVFLFFSCEWFLTFWPRPGHRCLRFIRIILYRFQHFGIYLLCSAGCLIIYQHLNHLLNLSWPLPSCTRSLCVCYGALAVFCSYGGGYGELLLLVPCFQTASCTFFFIRHFSLISAYSFSYLKWLSTKLLSPSVPILIKL